jgi:acetylornithine deacetylase
VEDGKLYGLGSNDAGGPLVSLLACFVYWYDQEGLSHNIVMVASAEEENSGPNGLNSVVRVLPPIDVAIVGEPTSMQIVTGHKGIRGFDSERDRQFLTVAADMFQHVCGCRGCGMCRYCYRAAALPVHL